MKKLIVVATTIGIGTAAFFGGQSTRMSDEALASKVTAGAIQSTAKAKREQDKAVKGAIAKQRKIADASQAAAVKSAKQEGYDKGYNAGYESAQGANVADDGPDEPSKPESTVTTEDGTWDRNSAEYRARCRDLYETWKNSQDEVGNFHDESGAMVEYGQMLCDQE
jgi:hypothetical protein